MRSRWIALGLVALVASTASAKPDKAHAAKPAAAKPASNEAAPAADPPAPGSGDGSGDGDGSAEADPFDGLPYITGPALVDLGHGAELQLPAGLFLFEREATQTLMRKQGNGGEAAVAAIVSAGSWTVVIEALDVGYVSDSDAADLDPAALLESYRSGTIVQNRERVRLGVPELFIDGWSELPRYDNATQHLVWGLRAHATDGKVINFFTRFLGRNGYLSVNLIDAPETIEASKVEAMAILSALRFKAGSRYADHVSSDKDSGMGLTALIVGGTAVVAAKKTGLLIALLIFLKKGFIIVFAAIAGFFRWLTGRGKKRSKGPDAPDAPSPPDAPSEPDTSAT